MTSRPVNPRRARYASSRRRLTGRAKPPSCAARLAASAAARARRSTSSGHCSAIAASMYPRALHTQARDRAPDGRDPGPAPRGLRHNAGRTRGRPAGRRDRPAQRSLDRLGRQPAGGAAAPDRPARTDAAPAPGGPFDRRLRHRRLRQPLLRPPVERLAAAEPRRGLAIHRGTGRTASTRTRTLPGRRGSGSTRGDGRSLLRPPRPRRRGRLHAEQLLHLASRLRP